MKKSTPKIGLTVLMLGLLIAVGFISYDFGKKSSRPEELRQEESSGFGTSTGEEKVEKKEYIEIGDKRIKIDDQPDEITFGQYFSELYLTRTEPHPRFEQEEMKPTNIFGPDDWFCIYGTTTQEVELFVIFINPRTGQNIPGHDVQFPPKSGKFIIGGVLGLSVGEYELRVYVKDILVKNFPIEVKEKLE